MAGNGTVSGGAKRGNINASLHKVYLKKLLDPDEQKIYNKLFKQIADAYNLDYRPADLMLLSVVLIDYIRAMRGFVYEAQHPSEDISDPIERALRSMRNNMSEMGITGKNKVIEDSTSSFSMLLAQIASRPLVP